MKTLKDLFLDELADSMVTGRLWVSKSASNNPGRVTPHS
jgi:hypothetical protein